ncbi:unnamed protein product [Alternaria alternata]
MRFFHLFAVAISLFFCALATDNGLQTDVEWDNGSLMVNGERVMIMSGEFHYARLPVPELWLDVFQKFKANGMNAVSIYFFWSYHSASKGVYDFTTPGKDIQRLFDMAKEAGLYVIARPGPYCNAETNGGGFRALDQRREWWQIIAKNQITNGGPVILAQVENELQQTRYEADNTLVIYMEQLKTAFKDAGIIVPLSHNEKGFRSKSWSTDYNNVGGAINVYGLDSYPGGMSCTNLDTGFNLPRTYYQWFQEVSPTQPEYLPEFEVVYTSYDYDAPLRETREVRDKFKQYKLLALFTRVSKGLHNTFMENNGTANAVDNSAIWTWQLKNRNTESRFYLAENNNTRTRAVTDFSMKVKTSEGDVKISSLQLAGRQSRWVITDYSVGNETLLYSSAEIATYGLFNRPVIVFYTREGQAGEFAFKSQSNLTFKTYGAKSDIASASSNSTYSSFSYTQSKGATVVEFSNGVLAYLLDIPTAYTFFAPATTNDPNVTPEHQIFVQGPYLVRSASISGGAVSVIGDNANATTIEVYAGSGADTISWNGKELATTKTPYGSLTAAIDGTKDRDVTLPELSNFKAAESSPEIQPSYDDSNWVVADKNTTLSPVKPLTLPVLFSSDYKYYTGAKIYRGYFSGKSATSLNITVQGGVAAGWNAWLNGKSIGYHPGNASQTSTTALLSFKNITLKDEGNVLTVTTDYTGHDQTSTGPAGAENPRGILGAQLLSGNNTKLSFDQWKIQGNAGGERNIDPVRGPMNEGGLYGERLGWHLPGFDTSSWEDASPTTDGVQGAAIRWFTTTFSLSIDSDLDVPVGIEVGAPKGTIARMLLFVNGYQYGKYVPHIGPQTRFPIPPGILNMKGENVLSVAMWAQTEAGAKLDTLKLVEYARYESGFAFASIDGKALQDRWEDRSQYA